MVDAFTHVDMSTVDPLEDLRLQMASAGVSQALVVETWDKSNHSCLQKLMTRRWAQFRGAFCFEPHDQKQLRERLENESTAGIRVRTRDLVRLGSLGEHLEASGGWLMTHAESGVGPLRDGLLRLSERHPRLRIYVPHLGWPRRDGQDDQQWNTAIHDLSLLPRCIVGISAIATFSREPYPHVDVQEFAVRIHEFFGRHRIVIGSDYPLFKRHMYSQYMCLASQWRQSASGATVTEFEAELLGNQENVERQP